MDEAEREYELGGEHDSAGRPEEALVHYERALELGPPDALVPRLLVQMGSTLRNVDRNDEAIVLFDNAVARYPDDVALRLFRAFCLATAGRDREALVDVLDLARMRIEAPEVDRYRRSLENYTRDLEPA
jgi:tetratricopeptide (TPR) repeat protein